MVFYFNRVAIDIAPAPTTALATSTLLEKKAKTFRKKHCNLFAYEPIFKQIKKINCRCRTGRGLRQSPALFRERLDERIVPIELCRQMLTYLVDEREIPKQKVKVYELLELSILTTT